MFEGKFKELINVHKKLILKFFVLILMSSCFSRNLVYSSRCEKIINELGFQGIETKNLNVSSAEQAKSLLQIFYTAGYFEDQNLWEVIVRLGFKNPENIFKNMRTVVVHSNADQPDFSKVDFDSLSREIFDDENLEDSDIADFIVYFAQSAFDRDKGKELCELKGSDWMTKYEKEYLHAAKMLNMIDRIIPNYECYDEAWIAGASRLGFELRFIDYLFNLKFAKVLGITVLLTGARPLWAEIDGIDISTQKMINIAKKTNANIDELNFPERNANDVLDEGKQYMLYLAKKKTL